MNRLFFVLPVLAVAALAQDKTLTCDDQGHWGSHESYCEMRETTIPAASRIDADGGMNGGVSIKSWDRAEVLVRAQVNAYGDDQTSARSLASQIHLETSAGAIRATGPSAGNRQGWGVSFEIFVPRRTDLSLKTHNGGVSIAGVSGHIEFEAVNGVSLNRIGGAVEGHTQNGGVHLVLSGDRWDGEKCDVSTTNGGVSVKIPSNYSAHLETGTVNGGMRIGFPVTVRGELGKNLSTDIGSGGSLVRVMTTNGGVSIDQE